MHTISLLNDIMKSANCDNLSYYIQNTYFRFNTKTATVKHMDLLEHKESGYCTLYHADKWTTLESDPLSGFYIEK